MIFCRSWAFGNLALCRAADTRLPMRTGSSTSLAGWFRFVKDCRCCCPWEKIPDWKPEASEAMLPEAEDSKAEDRTWLTPGCAGLCSRRVLIEVCCCEGCKGWPRLLREVQDWNPDSCPSELGLVDEALGTPSEQDLAKWAGVRWPSGRRIEPRVDVLPELLSSEKFWVVVCYFSATLKLNQLQLCTIKNRGERQIGRESKKKRIKSKVLLNWRIMYFYGTENRVIRSFKFVLNLGCLNSSTITLWDI